MGSQYFIFFFENKGRAFIRAWVFIRVNTGFRAGPVLQIRRGKKDNLGIIFHITP